MRKIILVLVCFLWANKPLAAEKAYIVFAAELNEIADQDKGSYPELASLLATYRNTETPTFFVFGGASLFPSILSTFDHGTHIIDLLNSLEPDVMAANKGDFTFAEDELSLRTYEAAFPIVQSNIVELASQENIDGVLDSIVLVQGDYKIGFISVMDSIDIEAYNLTKIMTINPRIAIAERAKGLRQQGADFVVLHYAGSELNGNEFLDSGAVDVVLRNHSYALDLQATDLQQHARQVFIPSDNQAVVIELNWQKGDAKTLSLLWHNTPLLNYPKDQQVQQQIQGYARQLDTFLDIVLGSTTTVMDLSRKNLRVKENGFGSLIADLMKKHGSADIAIINSGTIRGEGHYSANTQLTRRDIIKALPYRDKVVLLEVTGAQLLTALENGFAKIATLNGRYPQVSGITVRYDSRLPAGQRVIDVKVNNHPLEPLKTYKLATTDFIAKGGDGYNLLNGGAASSYKQPVSELIYEIIINELRSQGTISPQTSRRLVDLAVDGDEF